MIFSRRRQLLLSTLLASALIPCTIWNATRMLPEYSMARYDDNDIQQHPLKARIVDNAPLDFNFTIGICAIIKDMDAYLMEWLDYHLGAMGIENIYLYDHSKQFYLKNWYANTRNHPLYQRVYVVHWGLVETSRPQAEAYDDCVKRFGTTATFASRNDLFGGQYRRHDYLALIDGDEFLVPKGNYTSVHGVVKDFLHPYGGALTMNWMLFGSSNRTFYSPVPVTKRFQYRDEAPNGVVKTIVEVSDFKGVRNPHAVSLRPGKLVRTTSHAGAVQREQFSNASNTGASDGALPSSSLLVYHYRYLSEKEYDDKNCVRGHMAGKDECSHEKGKSLSYDELARMGKPTHVASRPGVVFDDLAWRLLRDRVPKYRIYDDQLAWGDYT